MCQCDSAHRQVIATAAVCEQTEAGVPIYTYRVRLRRVYTARSQQPVHEQICILYLRTRSLVRGNFEVFRLERLCVDRYNLCAAGHTLYFRVGRIRIRFGVLGKGGGSRRKFRLKQCPLVFSRCIELKIVQYTSVTLKRIII